MPSLQVPVFGLTTRYQHPFNELEAFGEGFPFHNGRSNRIMLYVTTLAVKYRLMCQIRQLEVYNIRP
jgi:hypothetical protein